MEFPSTLAVKTLSVTASEYDQFNDAYRTFADLSAGGAVLKAAVLKRNLYLLKKPKEVAEVFSTRQQRFSYTNLLGNILGWYGAALFKIPATIVKKKPGVVATAAPAAPGAPADPAADPALQLQPEATDFCAKFEKDADRAGTGYTDFWRKVFECLVLNKKAYVLIDLPSPDAGAEPVTLADQQKGGFLDPFLVLYSPSQMINWETDRYGNLEWCILAVTAEEREAFQPVRTVDYWYYFDREQVACYTADREDGQANDKRQAKLVDGYPRRHAMSDLHRMPVRKIELPDGLWLANRVFLPLLNHLNLDNAFDFALFQSALAQLVIIGDYNDSTTMSEVSYINIPAGGDIKYLEPTGAAYEAIDGRLEALEERIYKACYLMDQARTNSATPAAQSGLSKQQDKTPSRDALSGMGAVVRPSMQLVYEDVLAIRGLTNQVAADVRGFDYADKAGVEEMDLLESSSVIDVQSDTFRRERDKKFTRVVLPNLNPDTQAKIDEEISANPTPEAAAIAAQAQAQQDQIKSMASSFKGAGQIAA